MELSTQKEVKKNEPITLILLYPVALLLICVLLNLFVFGVNPAFVALPSIDSIRALVVAVILLITNHTWLMTTTELTRVRFKMFATPEEWIASGTNRKNVSEEGTYELERHHNTHRNTTENTVYYVLLSIIIIFVSPTTLSAQVWLIVFPVARIGYTYSYLKGNDNARGLFMSLCLLSMYGMASYLFLSLFV